MKGLFRPASSTEVDRFIKALNQWGQSKGGVLTPQIGTDAEISSCECCDIYSIEVETLFEKRHLETLNTPAKRGNLSLTSATPYGKVDIWSRPTPLAFKAKFDTTFDVIDIPGTELYKACSGCSEAGSIQCHKCNSGRITCGKCGGRRRLDCHGCNGYGYLECPKCTQGQIERACNACNGSGTGSCDGCGGIGSIYSNGHAYPCRSCNSSGHVTCRGCGGRRYNWEPCNNCHGGRIDCRTCRGQKVLDCGSCESDGKNTCATCAGSASLKCSKCSGLGGLKQIERLMMTTEITGLGAKVVHPLPQLPPVQLSFNGLDFVQAENLTSEMIVQHWKHPDLQTEVLNRFKEWGVKKPKTALIDRIRVLQTAVLEVKFKVQGEEGHAFLECSSGELHIVRNPIADVVQSTQNSLTANFERALRSKDYPNAENILAKAKTFNFNDLINKWRTQIDKSQEQDRTDINRKFIQTKKRPLLLGFGPALWLLLGFITPVNLFALVIMTFISWKIEKTTSRDVTLDLRAHQNELRKGLAKSAIILGVAVVLIVGWGALVAQYGVERTLEMGVKLTGRK